MFTKLKVWTAAAAIALLPLFTRAQTAHNINTGGPITISANGYYTIEGTGAATTNTITVNSGVTASITLNDVNINVSATDFACAFNMTGATVHLTLAGSNTLKSGSGRAGLQVPAGATLVISGTGSLTAEGLYGAGIGGGYNSAGGNITITGGEVTANGSNGGAGIGGGRSGTGGIIVITGGTIEATGGDSYADYLGGGAGIGGGAGWNFPSGASGSITIAGTANVTATGGNGIYGGSGGGGGAGIGSGGSGNHMINGTPGTAGAAGNASNPIIIEHIGNVTATGGTGRDNRDGANIGQGGGASGTSPDITPGTTVTRYTITVLQTLGGIIAPASPVQVVHGANQVFTVTANNGYFIDDVTVVSGGVTVHPTITNRDKFIFIIPAVVADQSIRATFDLKPYQISLNPSADKDFGTSQFGYAAIAPHHVTITNTSTQPTGQIIIALTGANPAAFSLSGTSITDIPVGTTDYVEVYPNTGLTPGTYTATVSITGGNGIDESFDVTFTVTPLTATVPTGLTAVFGQTLNDVPLPTGWAWDAALTTPVGSAGTCSHNASYTDTTGNYNSAPNVALSIDVARKDISGVQVNITGSRVYTGGQLQPSFAVSDGSLAIDSGDYNDNYGANVDAGMNAGTITLTGQRNYTGTKTVHFDILKATPAAVIFPTPAAVDYSPSRTLADITLTGSGDGTFAWADGTVTPTVGNSGYTVNFTPRDTANYDYTGILLSRTVQIVIGQATPTINTPPTAANIYKGAALSASALSGGAASVPGSFAWTDGTQTPASSGNFGVTFTPTDTTNYTTATASAIVTVIDRDALGAAIAAATALHGNAVEGTAIGQYAAGLKAVFKTAIDTAQGVYDTASASNTQAAVDGAVTALNAAIAAFNAGKVTANFSYIGGGETYTNASVNPTAASFDKNGGKDIAVTLSRGSYELHGLTCGGQTLKEGTDYTVDGMAYTIKASYLAKLAVGTHTITFVMHGGTSPALTVTVKDTTPDEPDEPELPDEPDEPDKGITLPFADVDPGDWYYDAVQYVYSAGLMLGTAGDAFAPEATLTRAMLVTVLYRLEGEPSVADLPNPFGDVPEGEWYTDAVVWAAANGIVYGYGDGRFGPGNPITKEQLAAIIHRTQQAKGDTPPDIVAGHEWTDWGEVSEWAKASVAALTAQGVFLDIPGEAFGPQTPATRAEIASVLYRYLSAAK